MIRKVGAWTVSSTKAAESLAMMTLYSHWQSSASYRVRIARNLKELVCQYVTLDLDKSHADQHRPEYRRINRRASSHRLYSTMAPF
jgi:hypothetical protein